MDKAKWIWHEEWTYDLVNQWVQARRSFSLKHPPRSAVISITADTQYRLYVNGVHVARGPARGFQESWPFDSVDISYYLRRGRNAIAVLVHQMGVGTYQYIHCGYAGLLVRGKVGDEDVSTGLDWKIRPAPGYRRVTTRVSVQLGFQEHFDARLDDDWTSPFYDDSKWRKPWCRSFGTMPWHSLEARGIPLLAEEPAAPVGLVSESAGKCRDGYAQAADVATLFFDEHLRWRRPRSELLLRPEWAELDAPASGKDSFRAWTLDFGEEVTGSIRLEVEGASGGEIIDSVVTEAVDARGAPILQSPAVHCRMAFGNRLVLRPGRTSHEQYDYWGFRYLALIVRNSRRTLKIRAGLTRVSYPLEVKAAFDSSDGTLNRVWEICVRTQRCCMFDAYVDCPWREQAQWWGDARVQAANTFYLSADARLLARGIRQIGAEAQETPNGLTYGHAPTISHHCVLPDFTLTWILTHWDYWWQTGDISLFSSMTGRVGRALAYFEEKTAENGLLPYDERYWLFLDWAPIFKEGYPTVYNLFYLSALRAAERLYALAGDDASARAMRGRSGKLLAAIRSRLVDRGRGEIFGGLTWKNRPVRQDAPHAYALAVLEDVEPALSERFVKKQLIPLVRGPHNHPCRTSPFYTHYVFEALKKAKRREEVVDCIARWWGGMVKRGLTTTEEHWNAEAGGGSLCHAWSAHPVVHLSNVLLGVWQTAPAWKEVTYSPTFTRVGKVAGRVATPRGEIESSWERSGDEIRLLVRLPRGVAGRAELPGLRPFDFRGEMKRKLKLEG